MDFFGSLFPKILLKTTSVPSFAPFYPYLPLFNTGKLISKTTSIKYRWPIAEDEQENE